MMEKYKALKEYIEECDKKGIQFFYASCDDIVSYNNVSDWDERENISDDLNALLKEWFDKQNDSVINDKA